MGRGANVNEIDLRNDDKFTPLHWAAHSGSLEVSWTFLNYHLLFFRLVYALASLAIS